MHIIQEVTKFVEVRISGTHTQCKNTMRKFTLLLFLLSGCSLLYAQHHLEGLWEGVMTEGGLHGNDGYKFELLIRLEGSKIEGRSYVHLEEGKVIEMDIRGYLYQDRSIHLQDIEFIPAAGSELLPPFSRKYQMIYTRSIWESKLEGFWQEMIVTPFDERRERGRILLTKKLESKA